MASYYEQFVNEWVVVELVGSLPDGRPPRVQLRQPTPLEWEAFYGGFPIEGIAGEAQPENEQMRRTRWRRLVQAAFWALEVPDEASPTGRRWQRARLVDGDSAANEWDIPMELFDRQEQSADNRNLDRCATALRYDLKHGAPFDKVADATFRNTPTGDALGSVGAGKPHPARNRVRRSRSKG